MVVSTKGRYALRVMIDIAKYGKESGGAVAGVAVGTLVSLSGGAFGFELAGYAIGGLVAGIFAVFGKLGCAISFLAVRLMQMDISSL